MKRPPSEVFMGKSTLMMGLNPAVFDYQRLPILKKLKLDVFDCWFNRTFLRFVSGLSRLRCQWSLLCLVSAQLQLALGSVSKPSAFLSHDFSSKRKMDEL
jgi:hypothetical protein